MRMMKNDRGFSLLELMACLALLALLAAVVLRVCGQGTMALVQAGARGEALDYAISIMEELRADPILLSRASAGTLSAAEQKRLLYDEAMVAELKVERTRAGELVELPPDTGDAPLYAVSLRVCPTQYPSVAVRWTALLGGGEAEQ
ncbi:MAG: prepilin-type N-terminal cleavage/methylation domain-containing protein [Syntrophomonadaceae bacterium]|nr:prepilin-type N-terminal cleavage/methylation domain-containing protein [Syntrophomonadaceae bacterium]